MMEIAVFKIGDRIQTPTGEIGIIIESQFDFPLHCLVQLPTGEKRHILKKLLKQLED